MKSYLLKALGVTLAMTGFAQDSQPVMDSDKPFIHRGEPMSNMTNGYNAPANVLLNNTCWSNWFNSLDVEADFTYWMAMQDGMELGVSGTELPPPVSGVTLSNSPQFLFQTNEFQPGFKIGLGGSFQDWTLNARYTWVNNHTNVSQSAPVPKVPLPSGSTGTGIWLDSPWIQSSTFLNNNLLRGAVRINSSWQLRMDLIDLVSGRPFYQSAAVTVNPFGGLRTALIRQSFNQQFTPTAAGDAAIFSVPFSTNSHSNSWALGPRVGGCGHCLLPMGFRIESMFAANLLFTRYTNISHSEPATVTNPSINIAITNYNTVRPSVETSLGLGWGKYLYNARYHLDFAASYEFQYYWNQNMIRTMLDAVPTNGAATANDLSLQGLTLTGAFYF